ncbi:hypothetical protein BC938DRAFT_471679 [Jimgerdemannia flammicorona]|uniref:Uncharacterized protein n=1 Tax=Jimgerdemannia flammicorona TaxID=994334 RepID=A0A433Q7N1_9FUNG|nr:hypothetical protein BC938DRAFT_471679 [Jimgerdemannia flammicorona]
MGKQNCGLDSDLQQTHISITTFESQTQLQLSFLHSHSYLYSRPIASAAQQQTTSKRLRTATHCTHLGAGRATRRESAGSDQPQECPNHKTMGQHTGPEQFEEHDGSVVNQQVDGGGDGGGNGGEGDEERGVVGTEGRDQWLRYPPPPIFLTRSVRRPFLHFTFLAKR